MLLKELLEVLNVEYINGSQNIEINGIAYDSRQVKKGNVFVCIKGFKSDGHNYISQAIKKGAVAIIVEKDIEDESVTLIKVNNSRRALAIAASKFYDNPSSKFKLIGVTGTNGKTTTTYLIKSILNYCGKNVGIIGTNVNIIGSKVIPSNRTTPESLDLQKMFSMMVDEGIEYVVMEVSSHSLELNRVDGCDFDIGIFTNITQDHLDFHGTMENYLRAKSKLFKMCKIGIINIDDKKSNYILNNGTCNMFTFGIKNDCDIKACNIDLSEKGVKFNIVSYLETEKIKLGIPGEFSVYNALGAISACLKLKISFEDIRKGLLEANGVPGRAEIIDTKRDFTVLIDYAHTPDGVENILKTVKGFTKGRVVTLFGCGGDRDRTKRPIMGEIAGNLSDFCIVTSDNPRSEEPMAIISDIEEGIKNTKCEYVIIENRKEAIRYALKNAKKNDVIILAGKGHETYQILKDKTIHFDEKEIVNEILNLNN